MAAYSSGQLIFCRQVNAAHRKNLRQRFENLCLRSSPRSLLNANYALIPDLVANLYFLCTEETVEKHNAGCDEINCYYVA